jgi:uncharacterized protein YndB with AHSA1/START domain
MEMQRSGRGTNALKRPIEVRVEATSMAPPGAVYALLTDPATHLVWGGERQGTKTRLLSIESTTDRLAVGEEFSTTGADPMGGFADRSVVTEATPDVALEFVTEAALTTKKGVRSEWTNVHRYEIAPDGDGSRLRYTLRVQRISALPGALATFNVPVLSGLAVRASSRLAKKGVRNAAAMAAERA